MLTAAITAAVAGVLSLFGIKPGAYLVGVAIVVKIIIVGVSVIFGARFMKKRAAAKAAAAAAATSPTNAATNASGARVTAARSTSVVPPAPR